MVNAENTQGLQPGQSRQSEQLEQPQQQEQYQLLPPPIFPTYRFGAVEEDLYRGGYPKDRNLRFLARLGLRTIVSLTPNPLSEPHLLAFTAANGITLIHIRVDKPKENIPLSFPKVAQILPVLIDSSLHPLYLHCLDGSLVTALVVMCLRKFQCWSTASYRSECVRYLKEEMLSTDEAEFVTKFTGDFEISHALAMRLPKWLWPSMTASSSTSTAGTTFIPNAAAGGINTSVPGAVSALMLGSTTNTTTTTTTTGSTAGSATGSGNAPPGPGSTNNTLASSSTGQPVLPFKRHPTLKVRLPTAPLQTTPAILSSVPASITGTMGVASTIAITASSVASISDPHSIISSTINTTDHSLLMLNGASSFSSGIAHAADKQPLPYLAASHPQQEISAPVILAPTPISTAPSQINTSGGLPLFGYGRLRPLPDMSSAVLLASADPIVPSANPLCSVSSSETSFKNSNSGLIDRRKQQSQQQPSQYANDATVSNYTSAPIGSAPASGSGVPLVRATQIPELISAIPLHVSSLLDRVNHSPVSSMSGGMSGYMFVSSSTLHNSHTSNSVIQSTVSSSPLAPGPFTTSGAAGVPISSSTGTPGQSSIIPVGATQGTARQSVSSTTDPESIWRSPPIESHLQAGYGTHRSSVHNPDLFSGSFAPFIYQNAGTSSASSSNAASVRASPSNTNYHVCTSSLEDIPTVGQAYGSSNTTSTAVRQMTGASGISDRSRPSISQRNQRDDDDDDDDDNEDMSRTLQALSLEFGSVSRQG
ncbi:hypothetical protein BASA50_004065 [Batrachochytrium salamandrivorans]|uniref:Protein-tyrosine-phosphatase n=1 Tax=Batrachochytrium salamandrivorans TaxID=1357716 RepID=A0ABQ8FJC9_9FUNG|nr:hypothetical protein BASA61_006652 [Batrachochytrium salamandrivorans]KAH6597910.1 hypothetical protein BASA50_004065 [Batrachochytrium salamandrivorans]KAH9246274.1 hypothetical protein BASA81_016196 [Batrachochytrium salamandrivorans]KAJ1344564.1 hypothetical protein BSLG_000088 [Batrachochytrium salamandrivorans]